MPSGSSGFRRSREARAIPALALCLITASANAAGVQAVALNRGDACKLAHREATDRGTRYSIDGTYSHDWEHGAMLEPIGCKESIFAGMRGNAAAKVGNFHESYRAACTSPLIGEVISGRFTGTFIRDKTPHGSLYHGIFARFSRFVIDDFESPKFDRRPISCGK